jgi:hypothetical protein
MTGVGMTIPKRENVQVIPGDLLAAPYAIFSSRLNVTPTWTSMAGEESSMRGRQSPVIIVAVYGNFALCVAPFVIGWEHVFIFDKL